MSCRTTLIHPAGFDLYAPGGVQKLLDFHYGHFGDARMEGEDDQGNNGQGDKPGQGSGEGNRNGSEDSTDWKAKFEAERQHSRKWQDRATANKDAAEKARKYDELVEANKTEEQKRSEEVDRLKAENQQLKDQLSGKDQEVLLTRVAASKGVPAKFLEGTTEEELTKSADEFLTKYQPVTDPEGAPAGYVGSQGTGDPSPAVSSLASGAERFRAQSQKN